MSKPYQLTLCLLMLVLSNCTSLYKSRLASDKFFELYKELFTREERLADPKWGTSYEEKMRHSYTEWHEVLSFLVLHEGPKDNLAEEIGSALFELVRREPTAELRKQKAKQILFQAARMHGAIDVGPRISVPTLGLIFGSREWVELVEANALNKSWLYKWRHSSGIQNER